MFLVFGVRQGSAPKRRFCLTLGPEDPRHADEERKGDERRVETRRDVSWMEGFDNPRRKGFPETNIGTEVVVG